MKSSKIWSWVSKHLVWLTWVPLILAFAPCQIGWKPTGSMWKWESHGITGNPHKTFFAFWCFEKCHSITQSDVWKIAVSVFKWDLAWLVFTIELLSGVWWATDQRWRSSCGNHMHATFNSNQFNKWVQLKQLIFLLRRWKAANFHVVKVCDFPNLGLQSCGSAFGVVCTDWGFSKLKIVWIDSHDCLWSSPLDDWQNLCLCSHIFISCFVFVQFVFSMSGLATSLQQSSHQNMLFRTWEEQPNVGCVMKVSGICNGKPLVASEMLNIVDMQKEMVFWPHCKLQPVKICLWHGKLLSSSPVAQNRNWFFCHRSLNISWS